MTISTEERTGILAAFQRAFRPQPRPTMPPPAANRPVPTDREEALTAIAAGLLHDGWSTDEAQQIMRVANEAAIRRGIEVVADQLNAHLERAMPGIGALR